MTSDPSTPADTPPAATAVTAATPVTPVTPVTSATPAPAAGCAPVPPRPPQSDGRGLLLGLGVLLWLAMTLAGPPHPAHAAIVLHPDPPPYRNAVSHAAADGYPAGSHAATGLLPVGRSLADLLARFDPPPLPWAAGHRGVDLAAAAGTPVRAARAGVVSFVGTIAGTGVVAVTHPGTGEPPLRTTYEPVRPTVAAGARVGAGEILGTVAAGSAHCPRSCLHWGLLRGHRYLDPLALLGLGHARLLPVDPDADVGAVARVDPGSGRSVGTVTPWRTSATALSVMAVGSSAAPISSRLTADSTTPCTRTAVRPGCRWPRSASAVTTSSTSRPCEARIRSRAVSSSSPAEIAATARCRGSPASASCART